MRLDYLDQGVSVWVCDNCGADVEPITISSDDCLPAQLQKKGWEHVRKTETLCPICAGKIKNQLWQGNRRAILEERLRDSDGECEKI